MKIAIAATLAAARPLNGASAYTDEEPGTQNVCTESSWLTTPQCCGDATFSTQYFIGLYCETCTL